MDSFLAYIRAEKSRPRPAFFSAGDCHRQNIQIEKNFKIIDKLQITDYAIVKILKNYLPEEILIIIFEYYLPSYEITIYEGESPLNNYATEYPSQRQLENVFILGDLVIKITPSDYCKDKKKYILDLLFLYLKDKSYLLPF